jgi:hypothetical protein
VQVLPITMCAARSEPPCGKRAATVFTLEGGGRSFRLERCADHAELMRAALQSLLAEGAWREEPLIQEATEL